MPFIKPGIAVFAALLLPFLPAWATEEGSAHEHGGQIFHVFRLETGVGSGGGERSANWDFNGWVGGDTDKLWLKSEGERSRGKTRQAEFWAMYSRNIATFWDAQAGIRHDTRPGALTYLTLGFEGLAPYFFETQAHLFLSRDGDISARLHEENDFLLTQRLILQPYLEANLYAQDVPSRDVGAGIADVTFGLQTRYEFTREFAPYLDVGYERKFGETASIARGNGEDDDAIVGMAGLRFMF